MVACKQMQYYELSESVTIVYIFLITQDCKGRICDHYIGSNTGKAESLSNWEKASFWGKVV